MLEDFKALGAPEEELGRLRQQMKAEAARGQEPEGLVIYEDIEDSVRAFEAMRTQWDRAGAEGVRVGLNYGRLPFVLRMLAIPRAAQPQVFEDLRVMEDEALAVFEERAAKA